MGLNDEMEKLRQAEEWLRGPVVGVRFRAALDHVLWVFQRSNDCALIEKSARILRELGCAPWLGEGC